MSTIVKTQPTFEPLTLQEAKDHLHVDTDDDNASIYNYLKTARRYLEWKYARALVQQTLVLGMDEFPWASGPRLRQWSVSYLSQWAPTVWLPAYQSQGVIELRPPVQSVVSITYLDAASATQTVSSVNYRVDIDSEPGRVMPLAGLVWPATAATVNAVKVEYLAGAASADLVPDDQKEAVRLLLGHYYLNREAVVTDTRVASIEIARSIDELMAPYAPVMVA